MYSLVRPLLFRLEPERAHALALAGLRAVGKLPPLCSLVCKLWGAGEHPVHLWGLRFRNPVGLAAGYDKDALAWRGLACLGFGHIEVGTVTPLPQPGNPRPRLFRLPAQQALINRMGFPGRGADFVAQQLAGSRPSGVVLGVNIGKNKATPNARAADDYRLLVRRFAPLADYLAVNVSSPNTEGLRRLQARRTLEDLLRAVLAERDAVRQVPLLVKLSPDLSPQQLDDALDALLAAGVDGVIATNTTVSREGVPEHWQKEAGGLSGAPLAARSTAFIRAIYTRAPSLPIIGVGGILTPEDALAKLEAGASLVQVFTGLVYAGPTLPRRIVAALP